jgi:cytochrome c553
MLAQDEVSDESNDDLIRQGSGVYSGVCSSCHQPGGAGLGNQFPPLVDNPNVNDTEYVMSVIASGLSGEIMVAGETFNGVMPPLSTLSDDDTEAVIAYLQNNLEAPAADIDEFVLPGGSEEPGSAGAGRYIGYAVAAAVAALFVAPRLLRVNDRMSSPWLDAFAKAIAIVAAVALFTIFIPDWALKTSTVANLDRIYQDIIGVGLWASGLALVLGGLWWAHRESRI